MLRSAPAPSTRWRNNQKQQYKAAVRRARTAGHYTRRSYSPYGPLNEPRKYSLRCSCRHSSLHMTEAEQILAERAHNLEHGGRR